MVAQFSPFVDVDDAYSFKNTYEFTIIMLNNFSFIFTTVGFLFVFISLNPGSKQEFQKLFSVETWRENGCICCKKDEVEETEPAPKIENKTVWNMNEVKSAQVRVMYTDYDKTEMSRHTTDLTGSGFVRESLMGFDDEELIRIVSRGTLSRDSSFDNRNTNLAASYDNPIHDL